MEKRKPQLQTFWSQLIFCMCLVFFSEMQPTHVMSLWTAAETILLVFCNRLRIYMWLCRCDDNSTLTSRGWRLFFFCVGIHSLVKIHSCKKTLLCSCSSMRTCPGLFLLDWNVKIKGCGDKHGEFSCTTADVEEGQFEVIHWSDLAEALIAGLVGTSLENKKQTVAISGLHWLSPIELCGQITLWKLFTFCFFPLTK